MDAKRDRSQITAKSSSKIVEPYTPEVRAAKIDRYKEKRERRLAAEIPPGNSTSRNLSRKALADRRPRVGGRFVKKEVEATILETNNTERYIKRLAVSAASSTLPTIARESLLIANPYDMQDASPLTHFVATVDEDYPLSLGDDSVLTPTSPKSNTLDSPTRWTPTLFHVAHSRIRDLPFLSPAALKLEVLSPSLLSQGSAGPDSVDLSSLSPSAFEEEVHWKFEPVEKIGFLPPVIPSAVELEVPLPSERVVGSKRTLSTLFRPEPGKRADISSPELAELVTEFFL